MKCPKMSGVVAYSKGEWELIEVDCLGKECAWYDSIIQQCLIYALHTDLAYLGAQLSEILKNMPTYNQFTK